MENEITITISVNGQPAVDLAREIKKNSALERYANKKAHQAIPYSRPSHYKIVSIIGDEFEIVRDQEIDWDGYSKRCRYPLTINVYYVTIPRRGVTVRTIDGIVTVINHRRKISDIVISSGWIVAKGHGYDYKVSPVSVAENGSGTAAHGETEREALKALERKTKAEERKNRTITLDTVITAADYRRITGACKPGTDAFRFRHGLPENARMTVGELLTILQPSDYGYRKIHEIVGEA